MIYLIAFVAACSAAQTALLALLLRLLILRARQLDKSPGEATEGGMDLLLLKPKPKRKAKRFTDKSRDWITAHDAASRR